MLTFVDTNVFVRLFVVADDETQLIQAKSLFAQAQAGEVDLVTGPPVLFEVAWVLGQRYKVENDIVLDILEAILSYPNLRVLDKDHVLAALDIAKVTNGTFADSYIAVSAGHIKADNVATFNKKHFAGLGTELYPFLLQDTSPTGH